jgi:hypothetical protein
MSRRWLIAIGVAVVLLTVLATLVTSGSGAEGSGLSPAPRGLVAARRYLEQRGTKVLLMDTPPSGDTPIPVLLLAFPMQRFGDLDAIHELLREGTTVVFAFSGDTLDIAESSLAQILGLEWVHPRGVPPLNPLRWRAFAAARWALAPVAEGTAPLDIRIPRRLPIAPDGAEVLFRAPSGLPVVFTYPIGRGRAIVLPVEVLVNAGLARAGHLDLLERLRSDYPGVWTFDEFHHGLSAPAAVNTGTLRVFDLYLLQLALIYVLALLALVRRFGPAWNDPPVSVGSAGAFLTGVGVLHHRLRHHAEARALLVARARELHPQLNLDALPGAVGNGPAALVALATAIARQQRQPRRTS